MPRFAAIDVGSNAMRLLVVEVDAARSPAGKAPSQAPGSTRGASALGSVGSAGPASEPQNGITAWRELASLRLPVRLGRDVFLNGRLAPSAVSAAGEALRRFREVLDEHKVHHFRAVATSAVREAENGDLLVERARRESGIDLDVIEGVEEARLVRLAVVQRLRLRDRRALLIDIGGGSTELSLVEKGTLRASRSLPVGTVRLLEAFHKGGGVVDGDGAALAREYIERQLREALPDFPVRVGRDTGPARTSYPPNNDAFEVCIGTGGNFETLALMAPALGTGEVETLGRRPVDLLPVIDVAAIRGLLPRLAALTPDERRVTFGLRPDRADVIVPAAEIILGIADSFNIQRIVAPGIGLKEGVLEELIEKYFDVWDYGGEAAATMESAIRLGRRYRFDEEHGLLVARLATDLFDQLRPLHRLGERDRVLLHTSALLHDVGDFIRYEAHHRHSHYILVNSDILGVSPRERTVIANIARYHRKGGPDPSHPNFRELERDDRARVSELAAILRIADALDREHAGKVTAVRAVLEPERMRLYLTGTGERQLEEWTVMRKSELFREVFDLAVDIARTGT